MLYKKNLTSCLDPKLFQNPTSEYRGTPFWAWNCKVSKEDVDRTLNALKEMGMGGAHIHSRTGMDLPYLSKEFMDMVHYSHEKSNELDMITWLYDEDRWPSGYGGGLVTKAPEFRQRFLVFSPEKLPLHENVKSEDGGSSAKAISSGNRTFLARYAIHLENGYMTEYHRLAPDETVPEGFAAWYLYREISGDNAWFNDQAYVDTLNPKAINKFIEITHEAYYREFGDSFGDTIPSIFTDEPQFCHKSTLGFADGKEKVILPYTDDFMFLRIAFFLIKAGAVPIMSLTMSACRPSILNGFRDFTRFGPCLERYKDTITEAIGKLYGSGGKGVYEIALAEWYYQNNNCFHALVLVTGTIPLMEQENDMRCLFVALALQMKILLVNGQTRTAKPLVEKIRKRIYETGWEELTSSLNAMECLAACYDGRQEDVEEWLEKTAPDENNDIFMMDMYAYLVKVRCYLQTGKYMVAHVLVKQLIALLTTGNRHMDLCECYMLSAIICHKAGDKKHLIEELTKTLELAGKFGYIRLLADEGNSMVQMLNIYQQEKGADELTDQIKLLAEEVGRYFPDYLKSPAEYFEPLTATETSVLRLMSQGLSNDEIAGRLGKKTGTVKFHTNNIFRKLQVQNRQQAVNRGREINLL